MFIKKFVRISLLNRPALVQVGSTFVFTEGVTHNSRYSVTADVRALFIKRCQETRCGYNVTSLIGL